MSFIFFAASLQASEEKYVLGPGDVIEISVWRDESLKRQLPIPPDGIVSYPLIGDINVNGMTVTGLRSAVTKRLSDYVPDATVTVMIVSLQSLRAYVIGKVNNPGEFPITMDTTVIQILAMARGLNPYASEGNIYILRRKKGIPIKIPFNYKQIKKGSNLQQDIFLQRGDVVVVP
jgi:polysaccharide export outer membrane protein